MAKGNRGMKRVLSADCVDKDGHRISDASEVYRVGTRQVPTPALKKKGEKKGEKEEI